MSADAIEKLDAGASLVQIYTGFVYEGPSIVKKINQGILNLMKIIECPRDAMRGLKTLFLLLKKLLISIHY